MNVLIVDDEPLARAGMRMLLDEESAITSVVEARTAPKPWKWSVQSVPT